MNRNAIIAAFAATAVLAGCSQGSVPSQPATVGAMTSRQSSFEPNEKATKASLLLYVGNYQRGGSNVLVFSDSGKTLKRTIALPNAIVTGLAVDASGDVFAGSGNYTKLQTLSVFKNDGAKPVKTLQQTHRFQAPTVDPSGNLFSACGMAASKVCEYAAAKKGIVGNRVIRRINLERFGLSADLMSTDASGDLAVSDQNHVSLFAPGATQPYLDLSLAERSIGIGGVTFDQSGNLYVAYLGYYDTTGIFEYAPGSSTPTRSFLVPGNGEAASVLRFDGAGNLYALFPTCNLCGPYASILVFAPDGTKPVRTITKGLENFKGYLSMAVDAAGEIFVANDGNDSTGGSIAVYSPNQSKPRRLITNGITNAVFLALTPGE